MHILEIPSFFPPYGGLFCLDQSKALSIQGNTVRIIANINLSSRLSPWQWLKARSHAHDTMMDGIHVTRYEMRAIPFCLKLNVRRWCRIVNDMVDKYICQYGKPDILHAHCCSWAGYAAMIASKRHNIPYVITEHLSQALLMKEFGPAGKDAWQVALLKEAYMNADMVVPVSEELVDNLSVFYGKEYKWKFESNTIDTGFYAYRQRGTHADGLKTICCIADYVPWKGYDTLMASIALYTKKYSSNIQLLIAGKNTDSDEMRSLTCQYGLEDKVKAYGKVNRDGVRDILYNSDCFFLATRSEVQPLVLLEAMCTGIPVVSTEIIPRCERIDGACFIGETDNPESLCHQLHKAMSVSDFDGRTLSANIVELASYDSVGKRLTDLFSSVCHTFHADK